MFNHQFRTFLMNNVGTEEKFSKTPKMTLWILKYNLYHQYGIFIFFEAYLQVGILIKIFLLKLAKIHFEIL